MSVVTLYNVGYLCLHGAISKVVEIQIVKPTSHWLMEFLYWYIPLQKKALSVDGVSATYL